MGRYYPNGSGTNRKNQKSGSYDYWSEIVDDPEKVDELSHWPLIGELFDWWYDYRVREEASVKDQDYERNTGTSWKQSKYPWSSYRDYSYVGRSSGGTYGDLFAASESVITGISSRLTRWSRKW